MALWTGRRAIALLLLGACARAASAQCPVADAPGVTSFYPHPPLTYPMTSNRYAVQYSVGDGAWTDAQVYISYYGGTDSSPRLSDSGYSAETSMSFASIPAASNSRVRLRVTRLFGSGFGPADAVSVRPSVARVAVETESDGTVQLSTRTGRRFRGEQFILWWDRGTEGGGIESLAFFLDPPYARPAGARVKRIGSPSDLTGDLSGFDTLDFEGTVAIGSTGNKALTVPANICSVFLGYGAWVQGKLLFSPSAACPTRRIFGPGVLDVSRFRYNYRVCGSESAFPDEGLNALTSSGTPSLLDPSILDEFVIDGITIIDHNHAATQLLTNSTVNNLKTLGWNAVNGGLRLGNNTTVSNVFIRSGDDSLLMWGSSVSITDATVWQYYNGGVVNLGWFDNSKGDGCTIDGLYVVKTDWHTPTDPSWTAPGLSNQNNAVIASLMVPGTKFGSAAPPIFRNIFVEDPPQVLLSLKILPPDCDLIGLAGTCPKTIDLTKPSVLDLDIEDLVTPPSVVANSIGFQTLTNGTTLTGTMSVSLTNVFFRSPDGKLTPLTGDDAATLGKLTTNGGPVSLKYSLVPRDE